jgi:hypothetical protein
MKKILHALIPMALIFLLTQCQNKNREKLVGIWQLQVMEVNGTTLGGNSLGNWLWEFNEAGGFLTDVAGMREKGVYKLSGNQLTLQHIANTGQPNQVFSIARLDSAELDLVVIDSSQRSTMKFDRYKLEGKEKD